MRSWGRSLGGGRGGGQETGLLTCESAKGGWKVFDIFLQALSLRPAKQGFTDTTHGKVDTFNEFQMF